MQNCAPLKQKNAPKNFRASSCFLERETERAVVCIFMLRNIARVNAPLGLRIDNGFQAPLACKLFVFVGRSLSTAGH